MSIDITGYGISDTLKVRKGYKDSVIIEINDDSNLKSASIAINRQKLIDALTIGMTEEQF